MEMMTYNPTAREVDEERQYRELMHRVAEYDNWIEQEMAATDDFRTWPLDDLLDELGLVRSLTPDQVDVISELEAEIEQRRAA